MTDKTRAFEEERVREQAKRLQEARLALGLTIHDFVQPLSTSRSQLDAIERGNVDAFYAPFYYERLFRRYAEVLSFSPEAIDEMVLRFSPDAPQDATNADNSSDESWAEGVSDGTKESGTGEPESAQSGNAGETSPESVSDTAHSNAASLSRLTSAAGEQAAKGDQASNWGIIAAFGLLAAGVVVALIVANSDDDRVPAKAPEAPATTAAPADNPNPQAESSSAQPAGQASGQPASNAAVPAKPPAAAGTTTPATAPMPAPAKSAPTAAPPSAPTSPNPVTPAAPAKAAPASGAPTQAPTPPTTPAAQSPTANNTSSPAAPTATPATTPTAPAKSATPGPSSSAPAMEVTPKARTWIWVREADEKVREFGVAAGEKVVFQEMPIYFVIARPGESDIRIQGKAVRLPRTDQERDIGRYGRSQLIEAKPASAN